MLAEGFESSSVLRALANKTEDIKGVEGHRLGVRASGVFSYPVLG